MEILFNRPFIDYKKVFNNSLTSSENLFYFNVDYICEIKKYSLDPDEKITEINLLLEDFDLLVGIRVKLLNKNKKSYIIIETNNHKFEYFHYYTNEDIEINFLKDKNILITRDNYHFDNVNFITGFPLKYINSYGTPILRTTEKAEIELDYVQFHTNYKEIINNPISVLYLNDKIFLLKNSIINYYNDEMIPKKKSEDTSLSKQVQDSYDLIQYYISFI